MNPFPEMVARIREATQAVLDRRRAIRGLGLEPQLTGALILLVDECLKIRAQGERDGAAAAFGLMGMAEAIKARRSTMPCLECGAPTTAWRKFCDRCE